MNPLDPILKPKSIAVVGASRKEGSIGREILHQLIEFDFHGKLFPVNPKADFIHSIKSFPSVSAIPDPVDLAIIVVARDEVLGVVDDCGRKGVMGLVVITAGFSENGDEGKRLEARLAERVGHYGMRMIGPNCMGVINTDPAIRMDATFAPTLPLVGRIAFMSQSGALGVAILNIARQLDIGFSYFVSMGNKTNVSGNNLLEYWEDDAQTDLILMYLESFGNARRFMQICRRISKRKPLLMVKSGRTEAGARAVSSHTGALVTRQGLDVATDALLEQSGVIRASTVEELFDLALAFSKNPLPRGNRLAILTNAGGPAVMATDSAIAHGLAMATFSERTRHDLRRALPPEAGSIQNPLDMLPRSDCRQYDTCARVLLEDDGVDMLLVVFVPPMMINAMDIVMGLEQLRHKYLKPVVGVVMATDEFYAELNRDHPQHMALYIFPESAVNALVALDRYRAWREKPVGALKHFDVHKGAAEELIQEIRRQGRGDLTTDESLRLMTYYGIPVVNSIAAANQEELARVAKDLHYPVVLKGIAPDLVHKTEAGAVLMDIRGPGELVAGAASMAESVAKVRGHDAGAYSLGYLVQEYVRGGREVIVGMTHDPKLGPLVMFGLGGIYVEPVKDVVFRVPPFTDLEAQEMIRQIRGFSLLRGVRGEPPIDCNALAEILLRFSQLAEELPEIEEIEINPLLVFPNAGYFRAVDARVRLGAERGKGV